MVLNGHSCSGDVPEFRSILIIGVAGRKTLGFLRQRQPTGWQRADLQRVFDAKVKFGFFFLCIPFIPWYQYRSVVNGICA